MTMVAQLVNREQSPQKLGSYQKSVTALEAL